MLAIEAASASVPLTLVLLLSASAAEVHDEQDDEQDESDRKADVRDERHNLPETIGQHFSPSSHRDNQGREICANRDHNDRHGSVREDFLKHGGLWLLRHPLHSTPVDGIPLKLGLALVWLVFAAGRPDIACMTDVGSHERFGPNAVSFPEQAEQFVVFSC